MSVEPAASVARDREPPRRVAGPSRRTRPSPPRPTRRPTCTPRPRRTSRRSGRSGRASGSTGRRRSTTTLEWDLPFAKWFTGGELNVAYNCVDRHVERGLGDKVAYHWIGEPGDTRTLTFRDLQREVSKAANALKELGVETGDRVAIYMPMIPELPIAMLACARIGAPHTVVFGGFSAEALSGRINDCQAQGPHHRRRRLPARQGGRPQAPRRRGARRARPTIEATHRRQAASATTSTWSPDRDHWWHDIVDRQSEDCPPVAVDSRAHALPALHVGDDGQAQGHPPHDRRLPPRHRRSPTRRSSTSSPTTCTGARPTSAG